MIEINTEKEALKWFGENLEGDSFIGLAINHFLLSKQNGSSIQESFNGTLQIVYEIANEKIKRTEKRIEILKEILED